MIALLLVVVVVWVSSVVWEAEEAWEEVVEREGVGLGDGVAGGGVAAPLPWPRVVGWGGEFVGLRTEAAWMAVDGGGGRVH